MRRIAAVGISIIMVASACASDDDSADTEASSDIETRESGAPSLDPASPATPTTGDEGKAESDETDVSVPETTSITSSTISPTEPPVPLDEVLLKQGVENYVVAFGNGDPDAAVSLLSERCADTIPTAEYRAAVAAAGELYPGLVVDDFYDIVLDGDRAVVYYTTEPKVETEDGERWIIESGSWVWDDC